MNNENFRITKMVATFLRIPMIVITVLLITSTVNAQTGQTLQEQQTIDTVLLSAIANIVSAFVALFTVFVYIKHTRYLSKQTMNAEEQLKILQIRLEDDRLSRQMSFHSGFQKKLREIQVQISKLTVNADNIIDNAELEILLDQYWSLVFDEWFTCKNGGADLKILWDNYYQSAVIFALQNPLYKQKIEKELNSGRSFLGLHREFKKDINELSWKAVSQGLITNHN